MLANFVSKENLLKRYKFGDRLRGRIPIEAAWEQRLIEMTLKQRVGEVRQLCQICCERAGPVQRGRVTMSADIGERFGDERVAARTLFSKFAKGVVIEWRFKKTPKISVPLSRASSVCLVNSLSVYCSFSDVLERAGCFVCLVTVM